MKPRLLDLFCGAGGCSMGYHRAGFDVVGVDLHSQKNYPFEFHQADAMTYPLDGFDVIHASPPCQGYSTATADHSKHPRLIDAIRERIQHMPYVIENVEGAKQHMRNPLMLCGTGFGLPIHRHRLFETDTFALASPCAHTFTPVGVYGDHPDSREFLRPDGTHRGAKASSLQQGQQAMGIDWMEWDELTEAIPPAYTEFLGEQLIEQLQAAA